MRSPSAFLRKHFVCAITVRDGLCDCVYKVGRNVKWVRRIDSFVRRNIMRYFLFLAKYESKAIYTLLDCGASVLNKYMIFLMGVTDNGCIYKDVRIRTAIKTPFTEICLRLLVGV